MSIRGDKLFHQFKQKIENTKEKTLQEIQSDINKGKLNSRIPFYYVKNTTNEVFSLSYILDMGEFSDQEMALAVEYLEYLE